MKSVLKKFVIKLSDRIETKYPIYEKLGIMSCIGMILVGLILMLCTSHLLTSLWLITLGVLFIMSYIGDFCARTA